MKSNIKEEILHTAKELFNQKGYQAVTMRDLAAALGISVGNLTYHYPKKINILLAIMDQTRDDTLLEKDIETLKDMDEYIRRLLLSLLDNFFYFQNVEQFLDDELIYESETTNSEILQNRFHEGISHLCRNGYFTETFTESVQTALAEFILLSHYSWAQNLIRLEGGRKEEMEKFVDSHWAVLRPYFTEKAKKEFKEMYNEKI